MQLFVSLVVLSHASVAWRLTLGHTGHMVTSMVEYMVSIMLIMNPKNKL